MLGLGVGVVETLQLRAHVAEGVRDAVAEREPEGGEAVGVAERVPRPVMEPDSDAEGGALRVRVALALAVGVAVAECEHEAEPLAEGEAARVAVGVKDALRLALALVLRDGDPLGVGLRVGLELVGLRVVSDAETRVREPVRETVRVTVWVRVGEWTGEAVAVRLADREPDPMPLGDRDGDGLPEAVGGVAVAVLGLREAVEGESDPDTVAVPLAVAVAVRVGLAEGDPVEEPEVVGVAVGVAEGAEKLRVHEPLWVALVPVRDAVAVGSGGVSVRESENERAEVPEAVAETWGVRVSERVGVPVCVAESVAFALALRVLVPLRLADGVPVGGLRVAERVRVGALVGLHVNEADGLREGERVAVAVPEAVEAVRVAALPEAEAVQLPEDREREGVRVAVALRERLPDDVRDAEGGDGVALRVGGVGVVDRDGDGLAEGLGAERLNEGLGVGLRDTEGGSLGLQERDRDVREAEDEAEREGLSDRDSVEVARAERLGVRVGVSRGDHVAVGVVVRADAVPDDVREALCVRDPTGVGEPVAVTLRVRVGGLRDTLSEAVHVRVGAQDAVSVAVGVAERRAEGVRLRVTVGVPRWLSLRLRVGVRVSEAEPPVPVGVAEVGVRLRQEALGVGVGVAVAGSDAEDVKDKVRVSEEVREGVSVVLGLAVRESVGGLTEKVTDGVEVMARGRLPDCECEGDPERERLLHDREGGEPVPLCVSVGALVTLRLAVADRVALEGERVPVSEAVRVGAQVRDQEAVADARAVELAVPEGVQLRLAVAVAVATGMSEAVCVAVPNAVLDAVRDSVGLCGLRVPEKVAVGVPARESERLRDRAAVGVRVVAEAERDRDSVPDRDALRLRE